MDCKGILTPILRTWVQKSTLLLQNRGHAEVLKKDPFFREIHNEGAAPLCTRVPPPPPRASTSFFARTPSLISLQYFLYSLMYFYPCFLFSVRSPFNPSSGKEDKGLPPLTLTESSRSTEYKEMILYVHII